MSPIVVRVQQLGHLFMAHAEITRVTTSPDLSAKLAGAVVLGCDVSEVEIISVSDSKEHYLVQRVEMKGATP